jgi:hypothetical protein
LADGLTREQLAEIRARCEAATPGPWSWLCEDFVEYPVEDSSLSACLYGDGERVNPATGRLAVILVADLDTDTPSLADRGFIALARQDVPALLEEVARLQAIVSGFADRVAGQSELLFRRAEK